MDAAIIFEQYMNFFTLQSTYSLGLLAKTFLSLVQIFILL